MSEQTETAAITPDPKKKKADKTPTEKKVRGPYKKKEANGVAGLAEWVGSEPAASKEAASPKKNTNTTEGLVTYDPFSSHVQVSNKVKDLIDSLPRLEDKELTELFRNTVDAERAMFVVRGAAAHEIFKRAADDGQKFDKTKGGGVDSLINAVAKDVGIDGKTLYADFRVFQEFGGLLVEQLTTAPETIMPREFYVQAMKTTTLSQELPSEILKYFQEQRESTGGYFTDHARRDTKLFNEGKLIEEVRKLDIDNRVARVSDSKDNPGVLNKPKDKIMTIPIAASPENIAYGRLIIDKYSSFSEWYRRKNLEEFGVVEESNN